MYWTVSLNAGTLRTFPSRKVRTRGAGPMTLPSPTARALPYGALALTSALWATSSVAARGLLDSLAPAWLTALRWVLGLVALAPFAWRDRRAIADALARHPRSFAAFAIVGFAPQTYLTYLGLSGTTAINHGLLNSAIPVLVVVIAAALHRRRPRALELAGLALSLAGVLVIIARGRVATLAALDVNAHDLLILASMSVWAYYTVRLARREDDLPFASFMFAAGLIGLAMIVPALAYEAATHRVTMPGPGEWAGVAYLSVLPTLVAMALFAYGVRRAGPVQAGLFIHLVPVFAALFATLLLGETLHAFHAAGFAMVACGAILGCLRPERDAEHGTRIAATRGPHASRV